MISFSDRIYLIIFLNIFIFLLKYFIVADIDKKEIWEIYKERPGLFQISLTASQNPPAQQIKHRMIASGKLIRCFPEGFTHRAAQNLLGVLYFYNGQFYQAVKTFEKALQLQPDSLTAMANIAFVYQRMKQNTKVTKYQARLAEVKENDQERKGIALAEQAFAFLFDCYMEKDALERNKLPKELFVQSLKMLENCEHHQTMITEIKYWLGQVYLRLFSSCHRRKDMEDIEREYYMKGVKELVEITKIDHSNVKLYIRREVISTSWAFLGLFLIRRGSILDESGNYKRKTIDQMDEKIKALLQDLELVQYLDDPEKCFQIGLEQASTSVTDLEKSCEPRIATELLIRYAIFLKTEERWEEALKKLNEALEIDNTEANWFALTVKAEVLDNLGRIDEAIEDRKRAISWNTTSRDICDLAKAYQKKYMSCEDKNSEIAEEFLLNASDCFTRAVQLLRQEKRPEIHCA